MSLTKVTKLVRDYHVWDASEVVAGDIIDIKTSLGGRAANSVTIESPTLDTVVKFNVAKKVFKEFGPNYQGGVGYIDGFVRPQAKEVAEVEDTAKESVVVRAGTAKKWTREELAILDIKIVSLSPDVKIIVD